MKSIPMEFQGRVGMGRLWSFPAGFCIDILLRAHSSQVLQKALQSLTIVGHQYHLRIYSEVRCSLKWPTISCALDMISVINLRSPGIQVTLSPLALSFWMSPDSCMEKSLYFSGSVCIAENSLSWAYPPMILSRLTSSSTIISLSLAGLLMTLASVHDASVERLARRSGINALLCVAALAAATSSISIASRSRCSNFSRSLELRLTSSTAAS